MSLPPGLARQIADFQKHGSDVKTEKVTKAPGKPQPPDLHPRAVGQDHFEALTPEEQDIEFGADIAAALRAGDITLADLVHHEGGFITNKPAQDVL